VRALAGMEVPVSARVTLGRDPAKAQIVFRARTRPFPVAMRNPDSTAPSALFEVATSASRNGTFIANGPDPHGAPRAGRCRAACPGSEPSWWLIPVIALCWARFDASFVTHQT